MTFAFIVICLLVGYLIGFFDALSFTKTSVKFKGFKGKFKPNQTDDEQCEKAVDEAKRIINENY